MNKIDHNGSCKCVITARDMVGLGLKKLNFGDSCICDLYKYGEQYKNQEYKYNKKQELHVPTSERLTRLTDFKTESLLHVKLDNFEVSFKFKKRVLSKYFYVKHQNKIIRNKNSYTNVKE